MSEGATERYERLAREFERDTGKVAPGKDLPPQLAHQRASRDEWDEWRKNRPQHES